jgi:hypothetical protein
MPPSSGVNDPLDVLKGIIGKRRKDEVSEGTVIVATNSEKPVQLVESIDFGDLSLEEFLERGNGETRIMGTEERVRKAEQCGFYLFVVRLHGQLC